jgi:hypothetical protein
MMYKKKKQTEEHKKLKLQKNCRRSLALVEHAPTPGTNPASNDFHEPQNDTN